MKSIEKRPEALDRPVARLVAVGVVLAGFAFLGWIFRGVLLPPNRAALPSSPAEAAYQSCVAPRVAQFEAALDRGELSEDQAALFRRRAEAFCADQANKGKLPTGPAMPGQ